MSKNLQAKKKALTEAVNAYNKTLYTENVKHDTVQVALDAVTQALKDYKSVRKSEVYTALTKAEHPMIEAAKQYSFTSLKIATDNETNELSVAEVEVVIDPEALDKKCGVDGGAFDKKWVHTAERLNKRFVLRTCEESEGKVDVETIDNSFVMKTLVKTKDLGKNPTSNNSLTKELQAVISEMIGPEYKATSHDLNLLNRLYVKKWTVDKNEKRIKLLCSRHRDLQKMLFAICARLVNEWDYEVVYEKAKN